MILFHFHLIQFCIIPCALHINIIIKYAARYYLTTSLLIKSTDEGYLPPSDLESFIARNVSTIHLRGRGVSRRLNIYDCRGISTTVIPPATLYSDIQTRHPCDCKSPEQYHRSHRYRSQLWFCLQSVSNTIRFHYLKVKCSEITRQIISMHFHVSLCAKYIYACSLIIYNQNQIVNLLKKACFHFYRVM